MSDEIEESGEGYTEELPLAELLDDTVDLVNLLSRHFTANGLDTVRVAMCVAMLEVEVEELDPGAMKQAREWVSEAVREGWVRSTTRILAKGNSHGH